MEKTALNVKTILIILLIGTLIFICFNKCDENRYLESKNQEFRKTVDSSMVESKKLIFKFNQAEKELKSLNADLLEAHNRAQVSETNLYALQRKTVKPIYIENIVECNDTIQSVYAFSIKKDSMCNVVIADKNYEIKKQDEVIKIQEVQKSDLLSANELTKNANKNLEFIIINDKKQIKKERLKKNLWKIATIGVSGALITTVIIK